MSNLRSWLLSGSAIVLVMLVTRCVVQLEEVLVPAVDIDVELAGTVPFDSIQQRMFDGVYEAVDRGDVYDDTVSIRWRGAEGSVFSERSIVFTTVRGGLRGDTVVLVGTWRFLQGARTGVIRLSALPAEGGAAVAAASGVSDGLVLRGTADGRPVVLRWLRRIPSRPRGFEIIGHRGGGRNSERLGISENSLPMIRYATRLGCTGVEIDVVLTKDRRPIVFHDTQFSPRTVRGAYYLGPVRNFTEEQIRASARLVNGEVIPSLDEALETIVSETSLRLVWLDVKDPAAVDVVIAAQIAAAARAAALGREVRFLLGLPTREVYEAYRRHPQREAVETLCELSPDDATAIDAAVWAPRWTAGIQLDAVARMHAEGRLAWVWTLDDPGFIRLFLQDGDFDGVLTNYPPLLAAIFYKRPSMEQ